MSYWKHKSPDSLTDLDRWRIDATQRQEARAQSKEQMRREAERQERGIARAGASEHIATLRGELATVRAELASLQRTIADAMDAVANTFSTLADQRHEQRAAIAELKTEVTKIMAATDQLVVRGRHDVIDLPNPLRRREMN